MNEIVLCIEYASKKYRGTESKSTWLDMGWLLGLGDECMGVYYIILFISTHPQISIIKCLKK